MRKHLVLIILLSGLLLTSGCSTTMNGAQKGAGVGLLAGGLVGALVSPNKLVGAAIGAGAGAVLGYMVGNEFDKYDQAQISQVAETVPSGKTVNWTNPDTNKVYEATPDRPRKKSGRIQREVIIVAEDGTKIRAKVRRNSDGTWDMI